MIGLFQQAWAANGGKAFIMAAGIAAAVMLALGLARMVLARVLASMARRTTSALDDVIAGAVGATSLWLLLPLAIHVGGSMLELPARLGKALAVAAAVGFALQAGLWGSRIARGWVASRAAAPGESGGEAIMVLTLVGVGVRFAIWCVVVLLVLDQLGFNITTLVAGLGIGGVAIALAVQNILGDLFASLSIVLDKPFVVGDFIAVDTMRGTVERVGMKTTRVRSLDGETLVFSNSDLLKSRLRNFKGMARRRASFSIGVTYETDPAKVRAIPGLLREAIEAQARTLFDRAHFKQYGDSSLVFEAVYFVLDADYNFFMDTQQAINLAILERFATEGIAFAYPTHTVHIATAPQLANPDEERLPGEERQPRSDRVVASSMRGT